MTVVRVKGKVIERTARIPESVANVLGMEGRAKKKKKKKGPSIDDLMNEKIGDVNALLEKVADAVRSKGVNPLSVQKMNRGSDAASLPLLGASKSWPMMWVDVKPIVKGKDAGKLVIECGRRVIKNGKAGNFTNIFRTFKIGEFKKLFKSKALPWYTKMEEQGANKIK